MIIMAAHFMKLAIIYNIILYFLIFRNQLYYMDESGAVKFNCSEDLHPDINEICFFGKYYRNNT